MSRHRASLSVSFRGRALADERREHVEGERDLGKLKHGWRAAWLGAAFGLILGFAGGAGASLVAENRQPQPRPIAVLPARSVPSVSPTFSSAGSAARGPSVSSPRRAAPAPAGAVGPSRAGSTCGSPTARLVRFRILVEPGLDTTPAQFVKDLSRVLCDERSWIGSGKVRFRYDPRGSLLIGLRTADSTERRCMQLIGLSVGHYYSCAGVSEAVLNADRWFGGSRYWPGSVTAYRAMLVNHEVGHTLGQRHRSCGRDGGAAPVMMQQSKGLTTGDNTCRPNSWPLAYEKRSLRS